MVATAAGDRSAARNADTGRAAAAPMRIRWYACTFTTAESKDQAESMDDEDPLMAECADLRMPLCHRGVCNDTSRDISIFVKRLKASRPLLRPQVLWMLQGGPGHSSLAMESLLLNAYEAANGTVSVYTMDHRGTGRSTMLECPDDDDGEPQTEDEIVECFERIKAEFGHEAPKAFSVTSAATDLKVLVQSTMFAKADVFVYGVSYGTYLVERLMHLQPSNVKGYILDSIQSEQFYTTRDAPYYSNWDRDVGQLVESFFGLCDKDAFCKAKIGPKSRHTLQKAYLALDAGETDCFDILYRVAHEAGYAKPSGLVGQTLYEWFADKDRRVFIPAYIYRLARCNADDQEWLTQLNYPLPLDELPDEGPYLRGPGYSDIVYNNIVFSEIWQSPSSPSAQRLYQDSVDALLSLGNIVYARHRAILYCLYRQNADPMCADYPRYDVGFSYERDEFWNHTATVPPGASVLMFSGGLDPATPPKYARDENATMAGDAKLLLEFPAANHGVLINSPDRDAPDSHVTCGAMVLASFMATGGDVRSVDVSCMARVEGLRFSHWDRDLAFDLFGSENPYNESAVQVKVHATMQAKFMTGVAVLCGLLVIAVVGLVLVVRQNQTLRRQVAAMSKTSDAAGDGSNTETHPLTAADSPTHASDAVATADESLQSAREDQVHQV